MELIMFLVLLYIAGLVTASAVANLVLLLFVLSKV
jgi:hypothetical protein